MKKLSVLILLVVMSLLFCSCDLQAQIEEFSENIYNAVVSGAGAFLKETDYTQELTVSSSEESSESSTTDEESSDGEESIDGESSTADEESSVIDGESSSADGESSTDTEGETGGEGTEPEPEPEPEPIPLPVRDSKSIDSIMGINASVAPEMAQNAYYINRYFSSVRYYEDYSTGVGINADESLAIATYQNFYGSRVSMFLDLDLSLLVETNEENADGVLTYLDLAKRVYEYGKTHNNFLTRLRLIELGKSPDLSIEASEYAKLLSLAYDGNNGEYTSEDGVGVSSITDEHKIIMGAFSKPDSAYLKAVMDSLAELRIDGEPKIVGGFNTNAFAPGEVSPEQAYLGVDSELYKMVSYRDTYFDYIELFIANFGYNTVDTESESYVDSEQRQADYLVRSFLIFAGLDIDGAYVCTYQDAEGSEYNGFGTVKEDGTFKISQYYLAGMKKALEGMTFVKAIENTDGAMIYEFKDASGNTTYAVWNPVSDGSEISEVEVYIGEHSGEIELVQLAPDSIDPVREGIEAVDVIEPIADEIAYVTVTATETPVFVYVPAPVISE